MSVTVDYQNASDSEAPDEDCFISWAEAALASVDEDCELSIRIVNEDESEALNSQYRGKNSPTNVLSFPFESPVPLEPKLLGDLVICAQVVEREANQQHKPPQHHWTHMVVHGCLHLLGYDHIEDEEADVMEALEVEILDGLGIPNPYLLKEDTP